MELFFLSSDKSRGRSFSSCLEWNSHCHTSPFSEFTLTTDYKFNYIVALLYGTKSHLHHELNLVQYTITEGYLLGVNTYHMSPHSLREKKFPCYSGQPKGKWAVLFDAITIRLPHRGLQKPKAIFKPQAPEISLLYQKRQGIGSAHQKSITLNLQRYKKVHRMA